MSCFIAPLIQAAATSVCRKHFSKRSNSVWAAQLPTLEKMLWGGSLVLIVDHAVHGELFTFNLQELLAAGLPMCIAVTSVWSLTVLLKNSSRSESYK